MKKKALFEKNAPQDLIEIQKWFASIITQKLAVDEKIDQTTPTGNSIIEEATKYITKSHTLKPFERIEIYNRTYWFRLIDLFHETYELTVRLFGYRDFNKRLSIPYLLSFPPDSWSLCTLGNKFVSWLKKNYKEQDKRLVINSAILDWAYQECFFAPLEKALDVGGKNETDVSMILANKIGLQPHIQLLTFPYNLLQFREEFIKQPVEFWLENDFPKLTKEKKPLFFVVYRNHNHVVAWKEIHKGAYLILKEFKQKKTLEEACSAVENIDDEVNTVLEQEIAFWMQEWTIRKWLVPQVGN